MENTIKEIADNYGIVISTDFIFKSDYEVYQALCIKHGISNEEVEKERNRVYEKNAKHLRFVAPPLSKEEQQKIEEIYYKLPNILYPL